MLEELLNIIRCPVTRNPLRLEVISKRKKLYNGAEREIVDAAILYSGDSWFYPVIDGIPRLIVEAFIDYEKFLAANMKDYAQRRNELETRYKGFIKDVVKKNAHTKASFSQEWDLYNYDTDKTWDRAPAEMKQRFLKETGETLQSVKGKIMFDAGCGNGLLNIMLADEGLTNVAMDFSMSIIRAFERNTNPDVYFIQGDVQFPPVRFDYFDIVHSSGVLIATRNTELSLSCIEPCVKTGGKLSTWSYQPRKDFIHNTFNKVRNYSSRLPVKAQYYLYMFTLLPASYVIKRVKGNKQNTREMMIDILDWFSPQFRWEHEKTEVETWYLKRNYHDIKTTDDNMWGFNMVGVKG